jgi:hypothetical protein
VTDQMPPGWENQVPSGPYGQPGQPPFGQPPQPGQPPAFGQPPQPGHPALPPYPQPGYGQSSYGRARPGGWNVAPAPGGVPLRPLSLGDILNGAVTLARRNPAATFGLSAIVMTFYAIITAVVEGLSRSRLAADESVLKNAQSLTSQQLGQVLGSFVTVLIPVVLVSAVLALALNAALTGMLSAVIGRGVLGRTTSLGAAWQAGRVGAVLAATVLLVLLGVGVLVPVAVAVVVLALLHLTPVAALLGVLGGIASIVFEVLLLIRLSLTLPAVVLERISPVDAIKRSWQLTHRSFWRLFGILLLTAIIVAVAADVLAIPFTVLEVVIGGGSAGFFGVATTTSAAGLIVGAVGSLVAATVTRPISAGVNVLLYVDLRMRREGLDLTLRNAAPDLTQRNEAPGQSLTGDEFAAIWRPPEAGQGSPSAW